MVNRLYSITLAVKAGIINRLGLSTTTIEVSCMDYITQVDRGTNNIKEVSES